MPKSREIGGCTQNSSKKTGLKFEFPKNEAVWRQWVKFVEITLPDISFGEVESANDKLLESLSELDSL